MAKYLNSTGESFTLSDLISKDGFTLQIGDDHLQEVEDEFKYSPDVPLSSKELMKAFNMESFGDEENDLNDDATVFMPCSTSFEEIKSQMIDLTDDNMVMKLMKRKGVGEVVPYNASVTVNYVGYLEYRDEPFDSTFKHGTPHTLRLDRGMLIPGLEMAICSMRKHEIAMFLIHPKFAFGELGCAPRIPPNEEVLFLIQLIDYCDNGSADTFENLDIEERKVFTNVVKRAEDMLNTARDTFNKNKTRQAIRDYTKVINWLENVKLENDEEEAKWSSLLSKAYDNIAICYNKENKPRHACMACNKVLKPTAKTYFNHGRALLKMGEYSDALKKLHAAYKIEPRNNNIYKEISLAYEQQRKYLNMQKQLWSNCLNVVEKKKEQTKFEKTIFDMCKDFVEDKKLLRLQIPEGLTVDEIKYVHNQAAAFNLSVTTCERYGKTLVYLNKQNY